MCREGLTGISPNGRSAVRASPIRMLSAVSAMIKFNGPDTMYASSDANAAGSGDVNASSPVKFVGIGDRLVSERGMSWCSTAVLCIHSMYTLSILILTHRNVETFNTNYLWQHALQFLFVHNFS